MNCQMEKDKEVPQWAENRVGVGWAVPVALGPTDRGKVGWGCPAPEQSSHVKEGCPPPLNFGSRSHAFFRPLTISTDKLFT